MAACWAVVSSGAVGMRFAAVVGSVPSVIVSAGTPIMVRRREMPIPFLVSKSWSAWSVVRFWPKNADEAPKPSIVCLVSDQLTVMSCDFEPQAARLAERPTAMARRDRFPIGALLACFGVQPSSQMWRAGNREFQKRAARAHGLVAGGCAEVRSAKACR